MSGDTILFLDGGTLTHHDSLLGTSGGPRCSPLSDPTGQSAQHTFFSDEDYRGYLEVMARWCSLCAYCIMANHVHLIVVP